MRVTPTLLLLIACLLAYVASKEHGQDTKNHAPNRHEHEYHGAEHEEGSIISGSGSSGSSGSGEGKLVNERITCSELVLLN